MKTVRSSNVESFRSENFFFSSSVVEKKKNDRKNKREVFIQQRLLCNLVLNSRATVVSKANQGEGKYMLQADQTESK